MTMREKSEQVERIGRLLDLHSIEWRWMGGVEIEAVELWSDGSKTYHIFNHNDSIQDVKVWLGY